MRALFLHAKEKNKLKGDRMLKRILLLSLAVITIRAAQMTSQKTAMASLEGLPAELKQLVLLNIGVGPDKILNIPGLAQGLTTLAATSKSLHAAVNNPQNMLTILKSLPKAGAVASAEGLRNMPGIKSKEVDAWLKSIKEALEDEPKLIEAIRHYPDPESAARLPQTVSQLLSNPNINVNSKDDEGYTALFYAKTPEIVRLLINAGANVNAKAPDGFTPLMKASYFGRIEIVKILLAAGADINLKDKSDFEETALMIAIKRGNIRVVKLLLAADADLNIKNTKGATVFDYAKGGGQFEILQLLKAAEKAQKEKASRK